MRAAYIWANKVQGIFLKKFKKGAKVSGQCTDILSVTTKRVVIFLNYQLT